MDVQVRRNRVVRRNRGALTAGAVIGAAIIGGAIIANSQRPRRQYYVEDGYYDGGSPYYGNRGYAVQPQPYYDGNLGYMVQPQPQYGRSKYYHGGGQPQIIYTPDKEMPYTYGPSGPGYYAAPQGKRLRDPAGGGVMR